MAGERVVNLNACREQTTICFDDDEGDDFLIGEDEDEGEDDEDGDEDEGGCEVCGDDLDEDGKCPFCDEDEE